MGARAGLLDSAGFLILQKLQQRLGGWIKGEEQV